MNWPNRIVSQFLIAATTSWRLPFFLKVDGQAQIGVAE